MDAPDVGIVFWILSAVIVISGLLVVSLKNVFHCALFLILTLFCVSGIFVLLEAPFLAAAQVLIYVGAVAVLIIFAVMLTTDMVKKRVPMTNRNAGPAFLACAMFAFGSMFLFKKTGVWNVSTEALPADNVGTIGKLLMTEYMLPFEVISVLLLAALIGAIVLARKESS